MAKWMLFVVLLLPAMMCLKVTHVSINGEEPHLTPLCSNDTRIPFIMCTIRTERWSDGCKLSHRQGHGFENNCGSKVSLKSENQTFYLHLDGLTQEDNGNYNCDCSNVTGTYMLNLSVTVEVSASTQAEDENRDSQMNIMAMGGAASVIVLTLAIFGIFYCGKRHEKPHKPQSNASDTVFLQEPNDIEPYSTFISRENGLYSTVRVNDCNTNKCVWN